MPRAAVVGANAPVIGGTDDEPGDVINIPPEIELLLK